jgi:hypothetical protein
MTRELKQSWPKHPRAALDLAVVYCGLRQKDQALYWLAKANDQHVGDLIQLAQDPHFTSLHDDRNFQALVKQVGIPQ